MNWNDTGKQENDGAAPIPAGWVDAWNHKHRNIPGYTYDGKLNEMV